MNVCVINRGAFREQGIAEFKGWESRNGYIAPPSDVERSERENEATRRRNLSEDGEFTVQYGALRSLFYPVRCEIEQKVNSKNDSSVR